MCQSFSLVVSCSSLVGTVGALLQHQHSFPMLFKSHRVSFNVLKKDREENTDIDGFSVFVDLHLQTNVTFFGYNFGYVVLLYILLQ